MATNRKSLLASKAAYAARAAAVWVTQQVVIKRTASHPPGIIHHCVDCSALSPPTDAERSRIGENAAWRVSRQQTRDGRLMLEWRCPSCWAEHFRATKSA